MPTNEPPEAAADAPAHDNYAFVMNVSKLVDAPAYDLAPDHQLRRATPDEVAGIREALEKRVSVPRLMGASMWEWGKVGDGGLERLPEAEWRYFVIAFPGTNQALEELATASTLAPLELELGFTVLREPGGRLGTFGLILHPDQLFHVVGAGQWDQTFFVDVTAADVIAISAIHDQLRQHDNSLINVNRLATQLRQLKALPHGTPLRFLGYFAILESVLTHAPKPNDPYDSITRQVKKKLLLLDHRWQPTIDYSPFRGTDPERLWAKMYDYRSRLAHGDEPTFTGDLAVLGKHAKALKLIKETAKAVIRQALIEPQLMVDLREC